MITRHGPIDALGAAIIVAAWVFVVLFIINNEVGYRWSRRR